MPSRSSLSKRSAAVTSCGISALLVCAGALSGRAQPADLDQLITPAPVQSAPDTKPDSPPPVAQTDTADPDASSNQPVTVTLNHPEVVNTATFSGNRQTVRLFGIVGFGGESAQRLSGYIASAGDNLTCTAQINDEYSCVLPNATDIALVALVNGAAQTRTDAPDKYREQEAAAQAARRGIWASLPPPPVSIKHPGVRDTATLEADQVTYRLDGVEGVAGRHASELRDFIVANGDSVVCQQQGQSVRYTCLMPDGTDVAKIVLVNGAARVAESATDAYRLQQREAITNKRGIWATMAPAQIASYEAASSLQPDTAGFPLEAGPASDGISYVAGQPTALVDGEVAFLVFGGLAGWGYYDHYHHWRGAPERFAHHLERFHPEGRGLRGYGLGGGREEHPRGEDFRPGGVRGAVVERPAAMGRFETGRPTAAPRAEVSQPAMIHPAAAAVQPFHPAAAAQPFHPAAAAQPFYPAAAAPVRSMPGTMSAAPRPAMAPAALQARPAGGVAPVAHAAPQPAPPAKHKS